jgi:hypothetical protein
VAKLTHHPSWCEENFFFLGVLAPWRFNSSSPVAPAAGTSGTPPRLDTSVVKIPRIPSRLSSRLCDFAVSSERADAKKEFVYWKRRVDLLKTGAA